jgi:uncharacterized protein YdeI (YjbR/CyaY-like superfamily)
MSKKNPAVDSYFSDAKKWPAELKKLRTIVLSSGLTEELKWRSPCYVHEKSNIVILGEFKEYCALSFFKGALLKDPKKILAKPGDNTQSGRLLRFTSVKEITALEPTIKAYLEEAIVVEESGAKINYKPVAEYEIPEELQNKFDDDSKFESAFDKLTPGRQKAYLLHFAGAKQSKTRTTRIESCTPRILKGQGLHDCVCGLSKRMPTCDGSHKSLG